MLKLLSCAGLVFCLLHLNEAATTTANFLKMEQRFDDPIYDSYYCCNTCGGYLIWIVDGETAASHTPGTTIGTAVKQISSKNTNVSFVSMILSVRNTSETCMDSVMIASQFSPDWRPPVTCQGLRDQQIVSYTRTIVVDTPDSVNNVGMLVLSEVIDQNDIVYPNNNCATQILICHSNDTALSWARDGRTVAGFNRSALPGEYTFGLHPLNSTIVLYEVLLLASNNRNIVSVIVWTDFDSVGSFNVSCTSRMDDATLIVNQPTTTMGFTTSVYTNQSTSTESASGRVVISPYLMAAVVLFGIAIICNKM